MNTLDITVNMTPQFEHPQTMTLTHYTTFTEEI